MKILHMSDLHLGAKTENYPRASEQKEVLFEIAKIADEKQIDIVAIAGDIFHVANPSAEAEDMLYEFLELLTKNNDRVVLVVAGNHDDPARLACCQPLAKKHNIVICTDLSPLPSFEPQNGISITNSSRGFVRVQKGNEVACIAMLPYATNSRLGKSIDLNLSNESYENCVKQWLQIVCENFEDNAFNMLIAHQYVVGALDRKDESGPKKVVLGEALAVPASVFPKCDYVALGHLHTNQLVHGTKNVYYCGATTKLRTYDESPCVFVLDSQEKKPNKILLSSCWDVIKLKAKNAQDATKKLSKLKPETLVYLEFTDIYSLSLLEVKELKNIGPAVVSIRFGLKANEIEGKAQIKELSPADLFAAFVKQKTGSEPDNELVELFLSLLEESHETN